MSYAVPKVLEKFIADSISKFVNEFNRVPSRQEMEDRNISTTSITEAYAGWSNVLKRLGFKEEDKTVDTDELMNKILEIQSTLNATPNLAILKEKGINVKPLVKKYGSWSAVKNILKAELSDNCKVINKEKLEETQNQVIELTKELGCVPKIEDLKEKKIKVNRLISAYGTWKEAKNAIGLNEIQENMLLKEIVNLQNSEGRVGKRPSLQELKENEINVKFLINKYGSWKNACNKLHLELYDTQTICDIITKQAYEHKKAPRAGDFERKIIKPLIDKYKGWKNVYNMLNLNKVEETIIFNQITDLSKEINNTPTIKDLRANHIKFSRIFKENKGWTNVKKLIGLPKRSKYTYSELDAMEQKLLKVGKKYDKFTISIAKKNKLKINPLISRYGSWNNLLFKLGFKLNNKYTDEAIQSLLEDIKVLAEKLGKTPTIKDLKNNDIPVNPLKRKYGSISKCMIEIGLEPVVLSHKAYNRDELLSKLSELKERIGKTPSAKLAKENGIRVNGLIREFGKWSNVKEILEGNYLPEEALQLSTKKLISKVG